MLLSLKLSNICILTKWPPEKWSLTKTYVERSDEGQNKRHCSIILFLNKFKKKNRNIWLKYNLKYWRCLTRLMRNKYVGHCWLEITALKWCRIHVLIIQAKIQIILFAARTFSLHKKNWKEALKSEVIIQCFYQLFTITGGLGEYVQFIFCYLAFVRVFY